MDRTTSHTPRTSTASKSSPISPTPRVEVVHAPGKPVKLTRAERGILDEALRNGQRLGSDMQGAILDYGRWLLDHVFSGDTRAALDAKSRNPVWRELLRRAGGPTLPVSRRLLYRSVVIVAFDRRMVGGPWNDLDFGRKELLLPLGTEAALRDGAEHVQKFRLTQRATMDYVAERRRETGGGRRQVRLTQKRLVAQVKKLRSTMGKADYLARAATLELDGKARKEALREIEALRTALAEVARRIER